MTRPPTSSGTPGLLGAKGLTPARAVLIIVSLTVAVVLASALVMRLFDEREFPSYGPAVWWAVQTVTTVGYGDIVPEDVLGRFVAGFVMLMGVAFISMTSGVTASVLVESVRKRRGLDHHQELLAELEAIKARLEELGPPPS
jgi:voltage-gated potassium channel